MKWERIMNSSTKKKAFLIAALFVAFFTIYALVLPAITLDNDTASDEPGLSSDTLSQEEVNELETVYDPFSIEEERENAKNGNDKEDEILSGSEIREDVLYFFDKTTDVFVSVEAPLDAFPEGTVMVVTPIDEEEVLDAVSNTVEKVKRVQAVDITFYYNGEEIEPLKPIKVSLVSDVIKEAKDPQIVHIDDEGTGTLVEQADVETEEDEIVFESKDFSTYVVVETEIETTVITADGERYNITVSYDENAMIPEGAHLEAEEILPEDERYQEYYDTLTNELKSEPNYVRFFDISIIDGEEKVQPDGKVNVKIELDDIVSEELKAVHFPEEGDLEVIKATVTEEDRKSDEEEPVKAVEFEAEGFSVYAVVDDGEGGENARLKVTFHGADGTTTVMYVKNADLEDDEAMKTIIYDPGAGEIQEGFVFEGWSIDAEGYPGANYTTKTEAMTIAQVREFIQGMTITEGDTLDAYAMIFTHYSVEYYEDSALSVIVGSESVRTRALGNEEDYIIDMAYTVTSQDRNFEGWTVAEGLNNITDPESVTEETLFENDDEIKIKGDIKFIVNAPLGHWLVFDENGKGATYNAPQFYKYGETTERPRPDSEMLRNGYSFGGWYAQVSGEQDETGYTPVVETSSFTFGGELDGYTIIYAKWIPNTTATYSVLIWKQNVKGDGYDFGESITLSGTVGNEINTVNEYGSGNNRYARVNNQNKQYEGFHLSTKEGKDYSGEEPIANGKGYDEHVKIKTEGNSVLNIYYDRNEVTLEFYYRGNGTNYVEDNTNGTWAFINDAWVQLTYVEGEDGEEGYWTNDPDGNPYVIDNENGIYGLVDGQYVPLTIEPDEAESFYKPEFTFTSTEEEDGVLYGIDNNGDYVLLEKILHTVTTTDHVYKLYTSTTLTNGDYLITSRNSEGSGYALGHNGNSVSRDSITVKNGIAATDNTAYIETGDVESTSIWTVSSNTFKNGNYYIQGGTGNGSLSFTTGTSTINWNWNGTQLQSSPNGSYLRYRNNTFTRRNSSTSGESIYLFKYTEIEIETTYYTYTLNGENYEGRRYLRTSYSGTDYYSPSMLTERDGELYYLDSNGGYVTTILDHTEVVSYSYYYNGEPYTGDRYSETLRYTGSRYRKQTETSNTWILDRVLTGLYGSSLASNGYTWPSERWWYESYDQSYGQYSGSGTRTTFLDAFIISDGSSEQTFYGFAGSGSNTVHFMKKNASGTGYTEINIATTSSGRFNISDKYNGYKAVSYSTNSTDGNNGSWTPLGEKDSTTGYYATVSNYTNLYIHYDPRLYSILFMDGVYVDGNNNPVSGYSSRGELKVVENIIYGSSVNSYNKGHEDYYSPTFSGFVFDGWYVDDKCTQRYTFSTMPEGITVYAKWIQIQYRVFLHSNVPTSDDTLTWGSSDQSLSFRVNYGGKVSTPTGLRDGYEFIGWYLDADFKKSFNKDAYVLNDTTVTTPYDKTTTMTDPENRPWEIDEDNENAFNSDLIGYNGGDRFWITRKLDLYAKWSKILDGAEGINVIYDEYVAGHGQQGTAPKDDAFYKDNTAAIAGAASKSSDNNYVFSHWVVQRWNGTAYVDTDDIVLPGGSFVVLESYARKTIKVDENNQPMYDENDNPLYVYTVQLRAEYREIESGIPTHIPWYLNDSNEAFHIDTINAGETVNDSTLGINEAVSIQDAPSLEGYTFLGWARVVMGNTSEAVEEFESDDQYWTQDLDENDLFLYYYDGAYYTDSAHTKLVTEVAADESTPYHAMFAVWERKSNYLYIIKKDVTDPTETDYLAGAVFTLYKIEDGTNKVISTLTSVATESGVAFTADSGLLDLCTIEDGSYQLKETLIPDGYGTDFNGITFAIEDGNISDDRFVYTTDEDGNGIYTYTVENYQIATVTVTKVVNSIDALDALDQATAFSFTNGDVSFVLYGTATDATGTEEAHAKSKSFTVRVGSTFTVSETENTDFTTKYKINDGNETAGLSATIENVETDAEITFVNTRKTVNVTLVKTNSDGSANLAGAKFELTGIDPHIDAKTITMDEETYVFELASGTYQLVEKAAPEGYVVIDGEIGFSVDATGDGTVTLDPSVTESIAVADGLTITVKNQEGTPLPMTGGPGTAKYVILGSMLIVGSVMYEISLRRKKGKEVK